MWHSSYTIFISFIKIVYVYIYISKSQYQRNVLMYYEY